MSGSPPVLALGVADRQHVSGTSGVCATWRELGMEAPGTGAAFRALFHVRDPAFRRLDRPTRVLVLAAHAAGLDLLLPVDARDATAIVVETERGSLDTDQRFARGLAQGLIEGAKFAYTLPSAGLCELALRYRFRGPAICLSIHDEQRGAALDEAVRLLEDGEARFAVACSVEVLETPCAHVASALRAVVAVLAGPQEGGRPVATWPPTGCADPFGELALGLALS